MKSLTAPTLPSPASTPTACALCGQAAPLELSHIIPAFVVNWVKRTSVTGFLRLGANPNRREQDGFKVPLLCGACEDRFGQWEKRVADELFVPLRQDTARAFTYGPWLAKFAVSMSWRVLTLFRLKGDTLAPPLQAAADAALATWRAFLLDRVPHPDRFEQHAILFDAIVDSTIPDLPTNINRYILRVFEIDVARNDASAFVYVKLCRLFVIGFIEMPRRSQWRDTRLRIRGGTLEIGGEVPLLGPIWPWIVDRARNIAKRHALIPPAQKAKIAESYRKDPDRAAGSGTIQATDYDVLLFGDAAFEDE